MAYEEKAKIALAGSLEGGWCPSVTQPPAIQYSPIVAIFGTFFHEYLFNNLDPVFTLYSPFIPSGIS